MPSHRIPRRLALVVAAAVVALSAAPAMAAPPAPSLTADTSFASSGFQKYDYNPTSSTDSTNGAGVDAALGRLYAVGEVSSGSTDDMAVVAWKKSGVLDPTFGSAGQRLLDIGGGRKDLGAAMAVLPDHRLRIVGATNVSTTSTSDLDVTIVGLLPSGAYDTSFGGGDGVVTFPVATGADDTPTHIAVGADGRLAIAGWTENGTAEDSFVSVRNADGSPAAGFGTNGVKIFNDGGTSGTTNVNDRGVGVAWRPGGTGPVVLSQVTPATGAAYPMLHAFTASGADDTGFSGDGRLPLGFGGASATGVGLLTYGGWLWTTGSVTASDANGFLARVNANGSGAQTRQFDARGTAFKSTDPVSTQSGDLTIVPGDPDTLVAGGSTATTAGREFSGAAFNNLGAADLRSLGYADLVIPVSGQGNIVGVAGAPDGSVAAAGSVLDYSTQTQTGTFDYSMTMSRLLVDAEKKCDLSITVPKPLELTFHGARTASAELVIANGGQRACTGTISVPAPYGLSVNGRPSPIATGRMAPGASVTLPAVLSYGARRPAQDQLTFTLAAPGDTSLGDNTASVHVQFSFCDARLVRVGRTGVVAADTSRRYDFTIRNRGTAACKRTHLTVGGAKRLDGGDTYTVPAGHSVTDSMMVGIGKAPRRGKRKTLTFTAHTTEDVGTADNRVTTKPVVVRGADSNARSPRSHGRRYAGTASRGKGVKHTSRSLLTVRRVDVAILRRGGKRCRWVAALDGHQRSRKAGKHHACDAPVWLPARGTSHWTFQLTQRLPKGRYVLLSRAVQSGELAENRFSKHDHNRRTFRVR